MKMEDMSLSGLDNSKLEVSGPPGCPSVPPMAPTSLLSLTAPPSPQAIAHEIYTDLVEDACLGLCFEVHRAVKCGYFFLDDTDPDSMKDFGERPRDGVTMAMGARRASRTVKSRSEVLGDIGRPRA